MATKISTLEANPLGHITGSMAISQYNYESILNALVEWENSRMDKFTVRLATNTEPYFVDYVLSTKHSVDASGGDNTTVPHLGTNKFAYKEMHRMSVSYDKDTPDSMVVRVTPSRDFGRTARIYSVAALYDESSVWNQETSSAEFVLPDKFTRDYPEGTFIVVCSGSVPPNDGDSVPVGLELRKTICDVVKGDDILSNTVPMVSDFSTGTSFPQDQMVRYGGSVYVLDGDRDMAYYPDNPRSGYIRYCACYSQDKSYAYGDLVEKDGMLFVYSFEAGTSVPPTELLTDEEDETGVLVENTNYWARFYPVNTCVYVGNGGTFRFTPATDTIGLVVRNEGSSPFGDTDEVRLHSSIRIPKGRTAQPKGVDIIPTCNYAQYPESTMQKWFDGRTYGPANASIGIYGLQDYTAVMTFSHASADTSRLNIVNYDGPDLDQGLAILLPVNIVGKNDEVVTPKDGCLFEFMFRIWPTPALNGAKVNDLIVNKAQIYVYNVTDYDTLNLAERKFDPSAAWPIAKFTMARMTNFYLYGENVAVPDRPVVYKARFIYSAADNAWRTFDYYQLPDHVFMAPNGFTDAAETAGFPMFQDPFSNTDLSPIRVGEEYYGRMRHTPQET